MNATHCCLFAVRDQALMIDLARTTRLAKCRRDILTVDAARRAEIAADRRRRVLTTQERLHHWFLWRWRWDRHFFKLLYRLVAFVFCAFIYFQKEFHCLLCHDSLWTPASNRGWKRVLTYETARCDLIKNSAISLRLPFFLLCQRAIEARKNTEISNDEHKIKLEPLMTLSILSSCEKNLKSVHSPPRPELRIHYKYSSFLRSFFHTLLICGSV